MPGAIKVLPSPLRSHLQSHAEQVWNAEFRVLAFSEGAANEGGVPAPVYTPSSMTVRGIFDDTTLLEVEPATETQLIDAQAWVPLGTPLLSEDQLRLEELYGDELLIPIDFAIAGGPIPQATMLHVRLRALVSE